MTISDNLRLECAFTSVVDSPYPTWTDITPYLDLTTGVTISAGRADEYSVAQAGTMSAGLDNRDGRFTPGLVSSPYFPNVKIRRKVRCSWRDPTISGNMIDAESASFEGGTVGSWFPVETGPGPTLANSTGAHNGTKCLAITWAAGVANDGAVAVPLHGVVTGRRYTFSAWVFVPPGAPAVKLQDIQQSVTVATSTTTNVWEFLSITFTAIQELSWPSVVLAGTATAGQQAFVDQALFDEGSTVGAFTTTPPLIRYRHTGYAEEWPTIWPTGGDRFSSSHMSSSDRFKRLGRANAFRSVIEEEVLPDAPVWYSTLGSPSGAVSAGDISGLSNLEATQKQVGAGGSITFGQNTGPPTDSLPAPAFAPVNVNNGRYLQATLPTPVGGVNGLTVEAFFLSSAAVDQTIIRLRNSPNSLNVEYLEVGLASTGKLECIQVSATGVTTVVSSAATYNNNVTHLVTLTESIAAGVVTMTLLADGGVVATTTYVPDTGLLDVYETIMIGGNLWGWAFTGTIAHVSLYAYPISATRAVAHSTAGYTGFSGERSDQRIARLARYAGVPVGEQSLEVGMTTSTAFVDITGTSPLQAMQDIATTENGVLFIDGAGLLTFQSRNHRYSAASAMTVTAGDVDPSLLFLTNDALMFNDITATNPAGAIARAVNAQSVADYGTSAQSLTLLTTSSAEISDAANWKAQRAGAIDPRCPNLTLDLMTSPALAAAALQLTIGSKITLSGLPSQAPAASVDLFIEGWTENISLTAWTLTLNTSPGAMSNAWILDSTLYSQLDVSTRLAY